MQELKYFLSEFIEKKKLTLKYTYVRPNKRKDESEHEGPDEAEEQEKHEEQEEQEEQEKHEESVEAAEAVDHQEVENTEDAVGVISGTIKIFEGDNEIGYISYYMGEYNIVDKPLRNRDVTSPLKKCISIGLVRVKGHKGERLGSFLITHVLMIGLQNDCEYCVLDDMSENSQKISDNIYASFGFTSKFVTIQKEGVFLPTDPSKQLKIPPYEGILRIFQNVLRKGGTKKRKKFKRRTRKN